MTSIINSHATNCYTYHRDCGGTILSGPDHVYCDRCGAVAYYDDDMDTKTWDEAMDLIHTLGDGENNL